jgi:hypothetical protein
LGNRKSENNIISIERNNKRKKPNLLTSCLAQSQMIILGAISKKKMETLVSTDGQQR